MKNQNRYLSNIKFYLPNVVYLLCIFFLLFFIFISCFRLLNSTFDTDKNFYLLIIILSVISIILLILILLYLNKELKIGFSLTIVVTFMCIYSFELYLELNSKNHLLTNQDFRDARKEIAQKNNTYFDLRQFPELIEDFKRKNIQLYPNLGPEFFLKKKEIETDTLETVPLGGAANSFKSLGNEIGFYSIIKTDEYGFNNISGLYESKIDIGIIGDSFAAGQAVKQKDNIASVLRYYNLNSISFGRVGIGPLIEYAIFKEYITELKPQVVLWLFYENDFIDLSHELKYNFLNRYLTDDNFSQGLISRQNEIDSIVKANSVAEIDKIKKETKPDTVIQKNYSEAVLRVFKVYNLRNKLSFGTPRVSEIENITNNFKDIIRKTKKHVSSWGGNFYFVYLPSYKHVSNKKYYNYEFLKTSMRELNVPLIDVYKESFLKHKDPLSLFPFRINGHYNEEGYRLVAETIRQKLISDKIF